MSNLKRKLRRTLKKFSSRLKVKRNQRRLLYLTGSFVICLLLIGLVTSQIAAHKQSARLQHSVYVKQQGLVKLTEQLQAVQKQKATTDQEVQQKAAHEAELQSQINDLNSQLQAKAAAKRQSIASVAVNAVTFTAHAAALPSGGVVAGCGDNEYAHFIYMHESGCNTGATNSSGCFGIGQACPASKISQCGTDYACQNEFFSSYANSRYGGWAGAYSFWLQNNYW